MGKQDKERVRREAKLLAWLEQLQSEPPSDSKQPEPEPDYEMEKVCDHCGSTLMYRPQWDAEYCPTCNEWKSPRCSDINCRFCAHRPERPY